MTAAETTEKFITLSSGFINEVTSRNSSDRKTWMVVSIEGVDAQEHARFLRRNYPWRTSRNMVVNEIPNAHRVEVIYWAGLFLVRRGDPRGEETVASCADIESERLEALSPYVKPEFRGRFPGRWADL